MHICLCSFNPKRSILRKRHCYFYLTEEETETTSDLYLVAQLGDTTTQVQFGLALTRPFSSPSPVLPKPFISGKCIFGTCHPSFGG